MSVGDSDCGADILRRLSDVRSSAGAAREVPARLWFRCLKGEEMSQGQWQDHGAAAQPYPLPHPVGFDPADPLISNDYNGWWRRSFGLVKAAWRPMAIIQAIIAVPTLAL